MTLSPDRERPSAVEAERAILGGILLNNVLMDEAMLLLSPSMFFVPSHREMFGCMMWLRDHNQPIDAVVIWHILKTEGREGSATIPYMTDLTFGLPHSSSIKHYARFVKDAWTLRQGIAELEHLSELFADGEMEPDSLLALAEEKFASMRERSALADRKGGLLAELEPEFDAYLAMIESGKNPAIPTGIATLDHLLNGGLMPGGLYGLVGRSGEGKSLLMKQWLQSTAKRGIHGVMFSLEMDSLQNTLRWMSAGSGVPLNNFSWGMTKNDMGRARDCKKDVFPLPIHVYGDCRSVPDIWSRVKELKRRYPIGWVVIDHYHLLKRGRRDRQENRTTDLEWMANETKEMAMAEQLPVAMPGQLDKEGTKKEHPKFEDARGGIAYYNACDVAAVIETKEYQPGQPYREAVLRVEKNRQGLAGGAGVLDLLLDNQRLEFYPDSRNAVSEERRKDYL